MIGLAGVTHHPETSDCCSCLHRLPQPHTWGLELKKFISHGFGGQISKEHGVGQFLLGLLSVAVSPCGLIAVRASLLSLLIKESVLLDQAPTLDLI